MKKQIRHGNWQQILGNFLDMFTEIPGCTKPFKPEPVAFTQAELQFLKDYLVKELTEIEQRVVEHKYEVDYCWKRSEKGTDKGESFLKCLNQEKHALRKEKAKQKKLVVVQQKIKGMLKTL